MSFSIAAETLLPSNFFRFGSLLEASSIQIPSVECFSSRGFPTNTRSMRQDRSASLTNSPAHTVKTKNYQIKDCENNQPEEIFAKTLEYFLN